MSRAVTAAVIAALCLFGSLTTGSAAQDPAAEPQPILVGNTTLVPEGKYPAIALIDILGSGASQCTGTLIAPRWVLTAAHCLTNPDSVDDIRLLLGSVDVRADLAQRPLPAGVELHQASGWIVHGDFELTGPEDDEQAHHDVALIQLPAPSELPPIPVATDPALVQPPNGGTLPAIVIGFGSSECDNWGICGPPDHKLREGPTVIATDTDAQALTVEPLSPVDLGYNIFLTPDPATHAALCFGDSGGPVLVTQNSQVRVAGVNSFGTGGEPCGGPGAVDGAADVTGSDLADWVRQVIDPPHTTCHGRTTTLEGTTYPDVIVGSPQGDVMHGRGGHDRIEGRKGPDVICGGKAGDHINGGPGKDHIRGNSGHDTILGKGAADWIHGGAGRDNISGGASNDRLKGAKGNDTIHGNTGNDTIHGNTGNDTLHGGKGTDTCRGGPGKDTKTSCEN